MYSKHTVTETLSKSGPAKLARSDGRLAARPAEQPCVAGWPTVPGAQRLTPACSAGKDVLTPRRPGAPLFPQMTNQALFSVFSLLFGGQLEAWGLATTGVAVISSTMNTVLNFSGASCARDASTPRRRSPTISSVLTLVFAVFVPRRRPGGGAAGEAVRRQGGVPVRRRAHLVRHDAVLLRHGRVADFHHVGHPGWYGPPFASLCFLIFLPGRADRSRSFPLAKRNEIDLDLVGFPRFSQKRSKENQPSFSLFKSSFV